MNPPVSLPIGLRDHLPERAASLRTLDERVLKFFDRHGYQYMISPLFEKLETFERAQGTPRFEEGGAGSKQFFRALDPHRGERIAFRPDILPQIARLVCSRLQDWALPLRFCYSGRVIRADDEPGALTREIFQAGCEFLGAAGTFADAEMAALSILLLGEMGLREFKIDLGHIDFAGGFFESLRKKGDAAVEARVIAALKRRDVSELEAIPAKKLGSARLRKALLELPHLFGGPEVLERAGRLADQPRSLQAVKELEACLNVLEKRGLSASVVLDLGEVRGFDYYTGIMLQGFAPGCGYPLLNGGRYDRLLGLFGRNLPAIGFAADLELILEALESQKAVQSEVARKGLLLVARNQREQGRFIETLNALEARRVRHALVCVPEKTAFELAERGHFRYMLLPAAGKKSAAFRLVDLKTRRDKRVSGGADWLKGLKEI